LSFELQLHKLSLNWVKALNIKAHIRLISQAVCASLTNKFNRAAKQFGGCAIAAKFLTIVPSRLLCRRSVSENLPLE
jgi:hypothetical protein